MCTVCFFHIAVKAYTHDAIWHKTCAVSNMQGRKEIVKKLSFTNFLKKNAKHRFKASNTCK